MRIGVMLQAYNEIEWLESCIESVKDWPDAIVVVEGAYQTTIKAGASPRSDDGTLDILKRYDDNPKFHVIHVNEAEQAAQLQCGIEVLKDLEMDWYMHIDGDEIYRKNDLMLIKSFIKKGDAAGLYQYNVNFYNFINTFDQYYNAKMRRIFKLTPGSIIVGQQSVDWRDHRVPFDNGSMAPHIADLPPMVRCFHYTEIKKAERWLLKKRYLQIRDGNPLFDKWHINKDGFVNELDPGEIKQFTGIHPEIIQQTELFKLWQEDKEKFHRRLFGDA